MEIKMNNIVMDLNGNHTRMARLLSSLNDEQVSIVEAFVAQILKCHDPDVVRSFLAWRQDPRVESILSLVTDLDDEQVDQLLFTAEELYDETTRESALCMCLS